MSDPEDEKENGHRERRSVSEIASARPHGIGRDRHGQSDHERGTRTPELRRHLAIDQRDGEGSPGRAPEGGAAHAFGEGVGVEEIRVDEPMLENTFVARLRALGQEVQHPVFPGRHAHHVTSTAASVGPCSASSLGGSSPPFRFWQWWRSSSS